MHADTSSDLFDQRPRCSEYLQGGVTVTHGLSRHLGPRWEQAEVKLTYEGQYPLEFISRVEWPSGADYSASVRHGILEALREHGESAIGGRFILERAIADAVDSSERAFSLVAREATASIIRLLQGHPKN